MKISLKNECSWFIKITVLKDKTAIHYHNKIFQGATEFIESSGTFKIFNVLSKKDSFLLFVTYKSIFKETYKNLRYLPSGGGGGQQTVAKCTLEKISLV